MNELEQIKKQLNDISDKIKQLEKPQISLNKWYKHCCGGFHFNDVINSYGIDGGGKWYNGNGFFMVHPENWTPATDEEVKEALIKEAKKIGFKEGVGFKSASTEFKCKINSNWNYNPNINSLSNYGGHVFCEGKWAEIIDEPLKVCGYEVKKVDNHFEIGCKKIHESRVKSLKDLMQHSGFKTVSFDNYSVSLEEINKILNL